MEPVSPHNRFIDQRSAPIGSADTMHTLYRELTATGVELACGIIAMYPTVETRPNETTSADYHRLPTPDERCRYIDRDYRGLRHHAR